ncbi:expressed unknown protein [Seminavis robusta]|uniref:Uncharacterized protein n=1 Tax=Seminavis robusta TaxID=568900 RepID=A0A9N8EXT4_9STRA|nr:expressed unknown protein [Seminavis robusta]|eukprot:Sro1874_g302970.1 n/a (299) ;mRNA; r:11341-12305
MKLSLSFSLLRLLPLLQVAAQGQAQEDFVYSAGGVHCVEAGGVTISLAVAISLFASASGNVAMAIGFNSTAASNSSFAAGVNSRTVSDPLVPGGSSGGGAVSMGIDCASTGDWAMSLGSGSEAVGYASAAIGEHAVAHTWGEVSLGLYTEIPELSLDEQRSQAVIPTFREEDVALRVGVGCAKKEHVGGVGCEEEKRHDAMRVYKSGRLYLKKLDGSVIEDVADAISTLKAEMQSLKEALAAMNGGGSGSGGASRRLTESTSTMDALFYMVVGGLTALVTSRMLGSIFKWKALVVGSI